MKTLADFSIGDRVKICGISELELILQCYLNTPLFSYLCDLDLMNIAAQYATIAALPAFTPESLQSWDGSIHLLLDDGQYIDLPMAAIADDEADEDDYFVKPRVVRHEASEREMVKHLAAETIQAFYR